MLRDSHVLRFMNGVAGDQKKNEILTVGTFLWIFPVSHFLRTMRLYVANSTQPQQAHYIDAPNLEFQFFYFYFYFYFYL